MKELTPQQEFIEGLRELAAWYENHPNAPVPNSYAMDMTVTNFTAKPEEIRAIGKGVKDYDDVWFRYIVTGERFKLQFLEYRSQVCTKKVVGTKLVPEQVIEACEAQVIPAHEEEVFEWECPGSLLNPEPEVV